MDLMEHVKRPVVDEVKLKVLGGGVLPIEGGTLCVTAFYLIFSSRKQSSDEITVLHTSISHLDYKVGTNTILLYLKDFRRFQLEFHSPEECKDMVDAIEVLYKPERLNQLYAFTFHPLSDKPTTSKWNCSSPDDLFTQWRCARERFRLSSVNKGFKVCPSYPEEVIVPSTITDEDIIKVAQFRHGHRFPVVCFHHSKTQAVLVRCGQPLCGHNGKKLKEDINMLNACLPSRSRGKIIDIRPQAIANQHMSKGGGVEMPAHYPQWKVEHAKFESPSVIQSSFSKLTEACWDSTLNTSSNWFGRVESSGWLVHVSKLLEYARKVTLALHGDASTVIVHGATSRDATLQLTSLSQILLDYRCRTIVGFLQLIEREWLDGGHQFSLRHHQVMSAPEKEKAPIFLLFLDAVWQVMQQFPLSFQFNERLLHTLFVHSYSSQYGSFLYDTPKERIVNKLKEQTHSLWDFLIEPVNHKSMVNPLYEKNPAVLLITVTALNVTLWKRLYLRSDAKEELDLPLYEAVRLLKEENRSRLEKLQEVKSELEALQVQGRKYASNWS